MRNSIVALSLLAIIAVSAVWAGHAGAQTGGSSGPWPTLQGNAQRTGVSTLPGPGTGTPSVVWALPAGDCTTGGKCAAVHSAPAVATNGNVYFGADDSNLYGFHLTPFTYTPLAGYPVKLDGPIWSAPTFSSDGSIMYVGTDNGSLYAINVADGSMKWTKPFKTAGSLRTSPVVTPDGSLVIIGAGDSYVYGVNAADGTQAWKGDKSLGGAILSSPAMSADGNTVYVGGQDDAMHPVKAKGGNVGTSFEASGAFNQTPSVDNSGFQYAGNPDGSVYSFDTQSPIESARWSKQLTGILSGTAVSGTSVYVASSSGKFYSLKTDDGSINWTGSVNGQVPQAAAPVVDNAGNIYVATNTGNVYGFGSGGNELWALPPPSTDSNANYSAGLAIGPNGWLLLPSSSGFVYVIGNRQPPPTIGQPTAGPTSPATSTATVGTITVPTTSATSTSTGPTMTPTPTPTGSPVVSPTKTTPPAVKLSISLGNKKPAPGQKEAIKGNVGSRSAKVQITVTYPNGDKSVDKLSTSSSGKFSWTFTVPASKITHTNRTATVVVKATANGSSVKVKKSFAVGFGNVDASAEPRTVSAGASIALWVHSKAHATITMVVMYGDGKTVNIHGATGSGGWFHKSVKSPTRARARHHSAVVYVWAHSGHSTYYTSTSFKVS